MAKKELASIEQMREFFARAAYHNIKQYQIAKEAGIREGTVSSWRIGKKVAYQDTFETATQALNRLIERNSK
jgi:transcriptional regulator with XRE-family HTH domain